MADRPNKVPPRQQGGARNRPGSRPAAPDRRRPTKRRRRGFPRKYLYGGTAVIAAAVIAVVVYFAASGGSSGPNSHQAALRYALTNGTKVYGGLGPENVPLELGPALAPASTGLTGDPVDGIQCGSTEQIAYHHHVHVALFVDGKPYSVPLGVGMVPPVQESNTSRGPFADGGTCLYWLHVHAQDGIVHIESPEPRNFELGQVMDIWHVPLSPTQLGTHNGTVTATVNGQPWTADPRQIPLTQHAEIVINVGTPLVSPPPISWSGTGL